MECFLKSTQIMSYILNCYVTVGTLLNLFDDVDLVDDTSLSLLCNSWMNSAHVNQVDMDTQVYKAEELCEPPNGSRKRNGPTAPNGPKMLCVLVTSLEFQRIRNVDKYKRCNAYYITAASIGSTSCTTLRKTLRARWKT